MSKTKIILALHTKPTDELKRIVDENKDLYFPVCGGASLKDCGDEWIKNNVLMDDSEPDNISSLNLFLNELTPLYLVWKNSPDKVFKTSGTANIGLCHYRRLFKPDVVSSIDTVDGIIASHESLVYGFPCTLEKQYQLCHYADDFKIFRETLIDLALFDAEVWRSWTGLNYLYAPCNCFVLKREWFNIFCGVLFKVAFELTKRIDVRGRSPYQQRACSFLCERFTSYWFYKQNYRRKMFLKDVGMVWRRDWA